LGILASLYDSNLATTVDDYLNAKTKGFANFGNILATIVIRASTAWWLMRGYCQPGRNVPTHHIATALTNGSA
jgi:hypothetical protein